LAFSAIVATVDLLCGFELPEDDRVVRFLAADEDLFPDEDLLEPPLLVRLRAEDAAERLLEPELDFLFPDDRVFELDVRVLVCAMARPP
jgi:hypothetical protein